MGFNLRAQFSSLLLRNSTTHTFTALYSSQSSASEQVNHLIICGIRTCHFCYSVNMIILIDYFSKFQPQNKKLPPSPNLVSPVFSCSELALCLLESRQLEDFETLNSTPFPISHSEIILTSDCRESNIYLRVSPIADGRGLKPENSYEELIILSSARYELNFGKRKEDHK